MKSPFLLRQQSIYILKFQGYQGAGAGGPGPASGPGPMPPPSSTGPNYYPGGPQAGSKPSAGPPNASVPPNGPARGPGYPYSGGPGPGPRPMYPPGNYDISNVCHVIMSCYNIIQSGWVGQEAWHQVGLADLTQAVPRPPQLQPHQLSHQARPSRQLQLRFKF